MSARPLDVVVIGGGQSALAVGYYLRRTGLTHVLLDAEDGPGGAWRHTWPSLRLFSPAQWSSLPGWLMPRGEGATGVDEYPTRDAVLEYLAEYERRYALPVERPVRVTAVSRDADDGGLRVSTTTGDVVARAVVSATGTWANPVVPSIPGAECYHGVVLHSSTYPGPASFAGKRVVVVGAGNSGAQIVAELSEPASGVAGVTWATLAPPTFLPDDVDGRVLFEQATRRYVAMREGRTPEPVRGLGDVVMVESVRAARERGALVAVPMFTRFTERGVAWPDGRESEVDAVILATGFRPALAHLAPLGVIGADGRVAITGGAGTRSAAEPRLWLVGYGEWTGMASATLIGVGRSARATVEEIVSSLTVAREGARMQ
ncbi:MAG TPA: ArsO family NAD(P)H-dependent flavin-containing monooxygenase [Gemmatimonadales bacterium]